MSTLSKFQIIVLSIFGAGMLAGLITLSLIKGDTTNQGLPEITLWGVLPEQLIQSYVSGVNLDLTDKVQINYVQKDAITFEKQLVEELALGKGPDAILIPQEMLYKMENKLLAIPPTTLSVSAYKNTYIEQAELYLRNEGIIGIPFMIDPMVMYWNRDLFTNAGIATYPKIWDEFVDLTKKINQKDVNLNIRKTAIALGEFANISNARDIFSLILLQAGNPIVSNFKSTLGGSQSKSTESALNFFIGFSNPSSPVYSWNRSLPLSKSYFLSGDLATYFGFASEVKDIQAKNPNLNFDIAPIPQPKNAKIRVNYAHMYGFSIVKSSKNPLGVFSVLSLVTSPTALSKLIPQTYLPPVTRGLIAQGNTDPYLSLFYDAALISKGWVDPDPYASATVFKTLVESVTSGKYLPIEAIDQANNELNLLLDAPSGLSAAVYEGLVQCDGVVLPGEQGKTKCDFVALIQQIKYLINWAMGMLVLLFVGVTAWVGGEYMMAGFSGNVSQALKARERLTNIIVGVLIVLFAWLVIRTILDWLVKPGFGLDLLGK